jgi:hypothetical protein
MPFARAILLPTAAALAVVLAMGTANAASTYRGVMTNGAGAVHSGEQGALWQSRFVEHAHGTVAYSACVVFRDARGVVQCKAGKTNRAGVDRLSFSAFVNAHPGRWVVRFFQLGRKLSEWRFVVRPEGS